MTNRQIANLMKQRQINKMNVLNYTINIEDYDGRPHSKDYVVTIQKIRDGGAANEVNTE